MRAALRPRWIADFLTLTPAGEGEPAFGEELARMRESSPETARADLTVALPGPLPTLLHRSDLPERAADLLEWVWTQTVLPYWPRRRRIMEADVVARTRELSQGGWAAALAGMRPGMRWLGEGRLQVNAHDYAPRKIAGAQLLFVPVTPRQGWVTWDAPHRYAVMYLCSGVLAQADLAQVPEALGTLLGPARAGVLVLLDTPKSTTQLVALTGQGLGSVGPPPQGAARCPPGAAQACRAVRALLPDGRRRNPAGGPAERMSERGHALAPAVTASPASRQAGSPPSSGRAENPLARRSRTASGANTQYRPRQ